ncbi:MAG: hypothetical protein KAT35_01140 [Candidatus Aenigmarchaeota archaeon]|nr:hypothetical protein [Candidatus Aenigmarchaeota archaeon]
MALIKLKGFPIRKQNTPLTCGYSAISMLSSFLGKGVREDEIPKGFSFRMIKGLAASQFIKGFEHYVQGYSMELVTPERKDISGVILKQLKKGLPVPFLFSTENPLDNDTMYPHYSIATGMDTEKKIITFANPFGYEEKLKMQDFLDKLEFKNYENIPFKFRFGLFTGMLKKRSVFIISKST